MPERDIAREDREHQARLAIMRGQAFKPDTDELGEFEFPGDRQEVAAALFAETREVDEFGEVAFPSEGPPAPAPAPTPAATKPRSGGRRVRELRGRQATSS